MVEKLDDKGEWGTLPIRVPPELMALKMGPDLQRFFDAMIYKLRRNSRKGRFETVSLELALEQLHAEVKELTASPATGSTSEILMEAADVANMALIMANISLEVRGV